MTKSEFICRFFFKLFFVIFLTRTYKKFPEKENHIGSVVIEILRYTQLDRHPPILYEFNMYCGKE